MRTGSTLDGPTAATPTLPVDDPALSRSGIRLFLKRDDLIDPDIPGNKWRKLRYNLADARSRGHDLLVTFGGAYSNHVRAVAAAGRRYGFRTVGVIRGEERLPLNWSLARAVADGMTLTYLDRTRYRDKASPVLLAELGERFGRHFLIPEGGSNAAAVRGCAELGREIERDVPADVVCCSVGSGGTLAGLAAGLSDAKALGFSALRGDGFLDPVVHDLQVAAFGRRVGDWAIDYDFHFGGYARRTAELDDFIDRFRREHGTALERVHVAKMLAGVYAYASRGAWPRGTRVVAVVTGRDDEPASAEFGGGQSP